MRSKFVKALNAYAFGPRYLNTYVRSAALLW